jgi:hypothetical protein
VLDHPLLGHLGRNLLVALRPADHVADGGDHLLVGEGLRAGQLDPAAYQLIGEQRAGPAPASSRGSIGTSSNAAYGPRTTSPVRIWAAHARKVLTAYQLGRGLTHSRPLPMAAASTSLFFSPLARDGCREGSKSTLSADMTTARFTPGSRASASGYQRACQRACRFPQDASRGR